MCWPVLQLSEAMAQTSGVFPSDYRAIWPPAKRGHYLAGSQADRRLLAQPARMRYKIASALVYPIILVLMSLASVAVIVFVLIPSISPIFVDAGLPLPGILHFVRGYSGQLADGPAGAGLCCAAGLCIAVAQGQTKSEDVMLGAGSAEMLSPGHRRIDTGTRGWRLCAGARHTARREGSVDVRDANRAGAGDQPASECPLSSMPSSRVPEGMAAASGVRRSGACCPPSSLRSSQSARSPVSSARC